MLLPTTKNVACSCAWVSFSTRVVRVHPGTVVEREGDLVAVGTGAINRVAEPDQPLDLGRLGAGERRPKGYGSNSPHGPGAGRCVVGMASAAGRGDGGGRGRDKEHEDPCGGEPTVPSSAASGCSAIGQLATGDQRHSRGNYPQPRERRLLARR